MDAVRFRIFADIRRGLVSWLVLSIVCGLLLSLSLGSAADARWGWAALPRSLRALNSADLIVFADRQSMDVKTIDRFLTAAERVPSVGGSSRVSAVNLLEVGPDGALRSDSTSDPRSASSRARSGSTVSPGFDAAADAYRRRTERTR